MRQAIFKALSHIPWTFAYINILSATINNFQYMAIDTPRELFRTFFRHTPTVWAVKGFNTIREHLNPTPFVNKVIDACQIALTDGYDGWDETLDGPAPDNIEPWEPKKRIDLSQ